MESGESRETPKPNNKASVTFPNTTNPPQSSPTDHHHQQQHQRQRHLIISSTSVSTNDHDISSPQTVLPSAAAAAEEHAGGGVVNGGRSKFERDFLDGLPPGYRFHPTDEELLVEYLIPEIADNRKYPSRIHTVNIFDYHPRQLAEKYRACRENEWYFFTPRKKKYFNGSRPDRSAGGGYWKATGADRKVYSNGVQVGARMSLVFQKGKHPKGVKTNWMMHEFTANTPPSNTRKENQSNDMVLDKCVLCRIYNKDGKGPPKEEEGTESIPPNEVGVGVGEDDDDNIVDGIINNKERGMMNHNSDYSIPPIPQSIVHPNPNPIHHLHDPPKPPHSGTHFSPNSFNHNSLDPNSNHYSNIASSSHHQVHYPPSDLHFNTHLFPNSLASSSHQLPEPPRHLYPNSHVYSNSFDPSYSNVPNHSSYTGGSVSNDATLSNLDDFACLSSYPFNVHAFADLDNFASPSLDPPTAQSYSNDFRPGDYIGNPDPFDFSSGDYIGNPDPCDFPSGLSPLASYDSHLITEYSTSNYPHNHQDNLAAGVSGDGESQLLTNPDQPTHWDKFEGDKKKTHPPHQKGNVN